MKYLLFRLAKYIASYVIVPMNGKVDALVFTGGIGENSYIKVNVNILYAKIFTQHIYVNH